MMFSLRSRILHVRQYQHEVTWITDLSLAMAKVCQQLAPELKMPPEEAFTLGLMHHIEYLVILGEVAKYTVANRGVTISRSAIAESIRRVGTQLHSLIARSWGIASFEKYYHAATGDAENSSDVSDVPRRLDRLQRILIETMAGGKPEIEIEGFDSAKLKRYVEAVAVRTYAGRS
jgi:HDOD domain